MADKPIFGVYQFQGHEGNPWNGDIHYIVETPEGEIIDLMGSFSWSKKRFEEEKARGQWLQLPTEQFLELTPDGGQAIIYELEFDRPKESE